MAYLAFTSGSTGKPKGIVGTHRPLSHFLQWHIDTFALTKDDRFSMLSGLSHDPLLRDIFTPLWLGATLYIPDPRAFKIPGALAEWMGYRGITVAHVTPSLAQLFTEPVGGAPQAATEAVSAPRMPLRYCFFGGEVLRSSDVEKLRGVAPAATCVNFYGATETPQAAGYFVVPGWEHAVQEGAPSMTTSTQTIPLGTGIKDVQLLVLTDWRELAAVGEVGEIHVRTPYLSRGYIGEDRLTKERFIANPLTGVPGDRLYKTGDLGRYRPDGHIEYLGRGDQQVNIRGFRVELGEIEALLTEHPRVGQAVVMAHEGRAGETCLTAYIVPRAELSAPMSELRLFLKARLPEYAAPASFVRLAALPLTPNGKTDRQALATYHHDHLAQDQRAKEEPFKLPRTPLQRAIQEMWEDLLGIRPISVRDNFFDLGGHSLLAVRLLDRIQRRYGRTIPTATLFAGATIEQLADALTQQGRDAEPSVIHAQEGHARQPFFFLHGDMYGGFYCLKIARRLGADHPLYALQPYGLSGGDVPRAIEEIARYHVAEVRAHQPEGPYLLGGFCNGGLIAFEMARQLEAQGQQVDLLVVIDIEAVPGRYAPIDRLVDRVGALAGLTPDRRKDYALTLRYYASGLEHFVDAGFEDRMILARNITRRGLAKLRNRLVRSGKDGKRQSRSRLQGQEASAATAEVRGHQLLKAYWIARRRYTPRSYAGQVTLLWPEHHNVRHVNERTMGWEMVAKDVVSHRIPGTHETCTTTHIDALAEQLRWCLDDARVSIVGTTPLNRGGEG